MAEDSEYSSQPRRKVGRPLGSGSPKQRGIAEARIAFAKQVSRPDWSTVDRAQRVIEFIEKLKIPSGIGIGRPFKLRPFQQKFIRAVYGPVHNNKRTVRRAILSMARKNGKTALIAALVLAHLIGPEAEVNGEIYSVANDREQAGQIFKVAAQIVRADEELSSVLRIIDSTKTINYYGNGSFYRAVSAESGTKHGLNPTVVVYDELAQSKNRELYDVMDTSMGAREEPLFIVISTQSNDPEHILSKLIDDGLHSEDPTIVCHLYAVDDDCKDVFDPEVWPVANPALGDFRSLEDFTSIANKAKRMPSEEAKFRNLYLNQRVSSTTSLITRPDWLACMGTADIALNEEVYLALDMSAVIDLTSLTMISVNNPTRVQSFNWKPLDLLKEHSARDFGSGSMKYPEWHKQGHLLSSPGRAIDKQVIAIKIAELYRDYKVRGLAYDRWRITDLFREFDRIGLAYWEDKGTDADEAAMSKPSYASAKNRSGLRCIGWGQGYKDMAPAVDAFEIAVINKTLVHGGNPVLTWAMSNAVATLDSAGNRKLDKEKVSFRIDPAVSLVMAIGLKARDATTRAKPKYQLMMI